MSDVVVRGGRVHALPMGEFEVLPDRFRTDRFSEGRLCPLCLDLIANDSTACRWCWYEWKEILADPRRLAEWIVYEAAREERLGMTVVWRKK